MTNTVLEDEHFTILIILILQIQELIVELRICFVFISSKH